MFPSQSDFVAAYLQVSMKERVFAKFPAYWADHVPEHLKKYCGVDLLLKKALYGYTYSGKFLFEEQADFFRSVGLRQTVIPALWVQHFDHGGILMVLHYSDDLLAAGFPSHHHHAFISALRKRFTIEHQDRASWYLQSRICQDEHGNIFLDQQQYSKSIVSRYLKIYDASPSDEDLIKYRQPIPSSFKWTKDDRSIDDKAVRELESFFGLRIIEAVGSVNYLANTFIRGLFCIRKACKFTRLPGKKHFKAVLHLLNHICCYPPGALVYFHDVTKSPLAQLIRDREQPVDPSIVYFTDSSHADCDQQRSTGCFLRLIQGGLVEFSSFVPNPIPGSSAESESNALCAGALSAQHIKQAYCDIVFNDDDRPLTIPVLIDSSAAEAISQDQAHRASLANSQTPYVKEVLSQFIDLHNLADIGILEFPVTDHSISCPMAVNLKRGESVQSGS
jgi:Reverse transcriptase (RNA-dependent DNA polymerase)